MALILLVSAIIATIVLIFQATLTIAVITIAALLSVSYLGFEAIWLWYNGTPHSTAWFIVGWFAAAFWLYVIYKFLRRER